ncbi:peptide chain release factor 2 [Methylacidimicrobium cyclopophantes]|nr:peptide chain release factor 2 [Methylacidimicrobium cyclopophantes]
MDPDSGWCSRPASANCGGFFDADRLLAERQQLEERMAGAGFWSNREEAERTIARNKEVRVRLQDLSSLERRVADLRALEELLREHPDPALQEELDREAAATESHFAEAELRLLLANPLDGKNAILGIHAGAGGTEACDWAAMLLRMYQRYAERRGFRFEILDLLDGEEAGVKAATVLIEGAYAYGYLKGERGVHRLVRISPFNAQGKRQTSFASVDVVAEVDEEVTIEIPPSDLRIDVFRSGGHGGQGVNTTDSAVRITHLPTGIVVTCQNQRSQLQNRATALRVLRSRLYEIESDRRRAEQERIYGEKGEIGWGRQIRSYVMQPYQLVRDLRTGEETADVQGVLDGELEPFLSAFLRGKKRSSLEEGES